MKRRFILPLLGLLSLGSSEPTGADGLLVQAMRAELERASALRLGETGPPYFLGYWLVDQELRDVSATQGALIYDQTTRARYAKVDLRVGSPTLDNSSVSGTAGAAGDILVDDSALAPRRVPIDDDGRALRRELWLATDAAYKQGVEAVEKKRAAKRSEVSAAATPASYSPDRTASLVVVAPPGESPGSDDPARIVERASAAFRAHPAIQDSSVRLLLCRLRRRLVTTDGGLVIEPSTLAGLEIRAETQAADGMPLSRSAFIPSRSSAPPERTAVEEAERVARELDALRDAKVGEDYGGPVLFEGRAAAQLVFELLGESLSGTPPAGGSDFLDSPLGRKLGKRILPRGFSIVDDPTRSQLGSLPLLGHYVVDDEGILGAPVTLVSDGYLRSFLMSRTPREGIATSNGHGRSGLSGWARGRPANLIVEADNGLSRRALRARLLQAVRDEGGDRGMIVSELAARTGASSGASVPTPEVAFEIGLDGTERLVRGLTLSALPVRALRGILAAGRDSGRFDFIQESDAGLDLGVSIIAPALLFDDVELRGPKGPHRKPPTLPRPVSDEATAPRGPGAQPASLQQRTPSE